MAFQNGLRSPRDDSVFSNYAPSIRPIGSQPVSHVATTNAERASLHRRFTTNALPTVPTLSAMTPLSPIAQQRRQARELLESDSAAVSPALFPPYNILREIGEGHVLVVQPAAQCFTAISMRGSVIACCAWLLVSASLASRPTATSALTHQALSVQSRC